MKRVAVGRVAVGVWLALACQNAAFAQIGAMLSGVGPVNRSMAGAATAAPLDTLGAFAWNPATITALPTSADFGLELLVPQSKLASTVSAGALGPATPPVTLSDSNNSITNAFPLPNFGIVYQSDNSAVTYGLGVISVCGFSANYPGSLTNPLLMPPPPVGLGVGPIFSQYQVYQIVPTLAYQVTEQLSIGISPIVDLANASADPGFFAAPDDANGNGVSTFPPLTHGTFQWGAGVQVGVFYVTNANWQFGASFKSPQWFQSFSFNTHDEIGLPRTVKIGLDAPMIASVGTAYTGFARTLIAVDARYVGYRNTQGFSNFGFGPNGAVQGLGWGDVFALAAGSQYMVTDDLAVRFGYSFNTNPIPNDRTFYNIMSPLVIQHGVSLGGSYNVTASLKISLAYSHFFENSISGPIISPVFGALPGTNVTMKASADVVTLGASFLF